MVYYPFFNNSYFFLKNHVAANTTKKDIKNIPGVAEITYATKDDELKKLEGMVDGISPLLEEIEGIKEILQDVSSFVSGKMSDFDEDGFSPDYIEERLFTINKIIKK